MTARFDIPAVVLGAGVNGLGVVRSLARAGVPVYLADSNLGAAEARTRYGHKLPMPAMHGTELVAKLESLGASVFREQRPVLILTQEESVRTVSEHRARIQPYYRFGMPPAPVMNALLTKDGFHELAQRARAPVPATAHLQCRDDLSAINGFHFPAVLKPGRRDEAYSARFKKAYRVESPDGVTRLFDEISPVLPDLVLQEWIEGADADIFFCLQHVGPDGEPTASFVGRKIRSWPPEVGGTASCIGAPEAHQELERLTTAFFRAVGFEGVGSMEFKRDRRSGRFLMVEPTVGRTDFQEEVATINGVNIPLAAYCHEIGIDPPKQRDAGPPRVWRNALTDKWSAEVQGQAWRGGPLDSGSAVDAHWRWYDPAPGWYLLRNRFSARFKRLLMRRTSAQTS